MKRRRAHLIAILLALIPLALIIAANELIHHAVGIGRPRGVFAFLGLRQTEASPPREQNLGPVRWIGTEDEPLQLFFLGSSLTNDSVRPDLGNSLTAKLFVRNASLCYSAQPIDRQYDRLKSLRSLTQVDLIVVEFSALFAADEHLVFRTDALSEAMPWRGSVIAEDLRALRRALWIEEYGRWPLPVPGAEALAKLRELHDAELKLRLPIVIAAEPRRDPGSQLFRSTRKKWRAKGVDDLAKRDRVWVRTQLLAMRSLDLIREDCRNHNIGLLLYVPPRAPDLRLDSRSPPPLQAAMARHSLTAVRVWARANAVPLLDYDAWSDREEDFRDSLHLNFDGARRFSRRLFRDLTEVLEQ